MKLKFEKAVFEHLKKYLNKDMSAMLFMGHSNNKRTTPYIIVDCTEPKPFGNLSHLDGLFELTLEIRIADSAHDINYEIQQRRINAILETLDTFETSEDMLIHSFEFESDSDARDDNNIGNILKYNVIVHY